MRVRFESDPYVEMGDFAFSSTQRRVPFWRRWKTHKFEDTIPDTHVDKLRVYTVGPNATHTDLQTGINIVSQTSDGSDVKIKEAKIDGVTPCEVEEDDGVFEILAATTP